MPRALLSKWILGIALVALATTARAQVQQYGSVTPNHSVMWTYPGVIADAGTPANPGLSALGLFNGPNNPLSINSTTSPGTPSGQYATLSFGVSNTQGLLTLQSYGGLATLPLNVNLNGTIYPLLPSTGGGNVTGPVTSVANDIAAFNNTTGNLLKDSGISISSLTPIISPSGTTGAVLTNQGGTPAYNLLNAVPVTALGMKCDGSTNDTTALTNALATGLSILIPAGTCIITPGSITITTNGQGISGAGEFLTTLQSTSGSTDLIAFSGVSGGWLANLSLNSAATSGNAFSVTSPVESAQNFYAYNVDISGPQNGISLSGVKNVTFNAVNVRSATGTYALTIVGPSAQRSDTINLLNGQFTAANANTTTNGIVINGNVHTVRLYGVATQNGAIGLLLENTNSGALDPSGVNAFDLETNNQANEGVRITAGSGFHFNYLYANNGSSTTDCVYVASGLSDIEIFNPNFSGCGQNGINTSASQVKVIGGQIKGAGQLASLTYSGIAIGASAADTTVTNVTTDVTGSAHEAYGVSIASGATSTKLIANTLSGQLGKFNDLSGVAYVIDSQIGQIYPPGVVIGASPVFEDTATNLALQSDNISVSPWSFTNASAGTPVESPNGQTLGYKIAETTASGSHGVSQQISGLSASTNYLVACFLKPGNYNFATIDLIDESNTANSESFSLSGSGASYSQIHATIVSSGITPYANGWYRAWIVANTSSGATTPSIRVRNTPDGTTVSYAGTSGNGVYVGGCDMFQGTTLFAHIPTGAAAGVRPANALAIQPFIVGHPISHSLPPLLGSGSGDCGTSPSLAAYSTDDVGRVTVGSSTNGGKCTITFAASWTNAPICSVQDETSGASVYPVPTQTTLAITAVSTLTAAHVLSYSCRGAQ